MFSVESLPLVGIPACFRPINDFTFHTVGDKYVRAVSDGAKALPMLIPALGSQIDVEALAARLDGLFLTGSPSNVEPGRYGAGEALSVPPHDPDRDDTTLPLIRACIRQAVPLFGVCRGLQELNVAFGGTLHPKLHEVPGRMDHRGGPGSPEERYRLKHDVAVTPGGPLARIGGTLNPMVNSLHGQGIDRLGDGLTVEAVAPDGTIEAIGVVGAPAFALAVQWHPEWQFWQDALSTRLLHAFGEAVRARAAARSGSMTAVGERRAAAE